MDSPLKKNNKNIPSLTGALSLLALMIAADGLTAPLKTERRIHLGASIERFHYAEYTDDDDLYLTEKGPLPGVFAEMEWQNGPWLTGFGVHLRYGDVQYDGQRLSDGLPVRTRTDETVGDGWLRIGHRFQPLPDLDLDLFAGAGFRRWHRDIRDSALSSGLVEIYDSGYGFIETRLHKSLSQTLDGSIGVRLVHTINPHMKVTFSDIGHFDMELGEKPGLRAETSLSWQTGTPYRLVVSPFAEFWRFGRSANYGWSLANGSSGAIFEPRSETDRYGVRLGVSRVF